MSASAHQSAPSATPQMQIGECFAGDGANAAHVNTVLGASDGPVGVAWAGALARPSPGHIPFVAVLRPNLATKPLTLFVNKATIASDRHGSLTWGAAQAGIATGVARAVADGVVDRDLVDSLLLIAAVWVDPDAHSEDLIFENNADAVLGALRNGDAAEPNIAEVLASIDRVENPFFRPRRGGC